MCNLLGSTYLNAKYADLHLRFFKDIGTICHLDDVVDGDVMFSLKCFSTCLSGWNNEEIMVTVVV